MQTAGTPPRGMRDLEPAILLKRQFMLGIIRNTFQKYGFLPLETPAMERLSNLTGKYGSEGDELLFRVLNSGDYLDGVDPDMLAQHNAKALAGKIADKGMRYDLTVPLARYVAANRHSLALPFRRFQIQPVWRADRPQKGRYREFLQCDADVVGSRSLLCEAEMMGIIGEVFERLNIARYRVRLNHRGTLAGLAQLAGAHDEGAFFSTLDKWDKIGAEKVQEEWRKQGVETDPLMDIFHCFASQPTAAKQIRFLLEQMPSSAPMRQAASDFEEFYRFLSDMEIPDAHISLDIALARGLSYYTGLIFEAAIDDAPIGSVVGGGRYDNLAGVFGLPDVSGVGFSFGVDRIYDAMELLSLFPNEAGAPPTTLIAHLDEAGMRYGAGVLAQLRRQGLCAILYPEVCKIKKQMSYADKRGAVFVIVIGKEEIASGLLTLKRMHTGEQKQLPLGRIFDEIESFNT